MKRNNKFLIKYKIYIIISILFVVWGCFVFFVILPSVKLLQDDFDAVQIKFLEMKVNDEKLSNVDVLKEKFDKVDSERSNLEVIFSKDNIVELVRELELIAQKTENTVTVSVDEENKALVEVNKSKAGASSKDNEFLKLLPSENYLTLKIGLKGDYNGLIKFIDKLNSIKYYNTVIGFRIISEKVPLDDKGVSSNSGDQISVMNSGDNIENIVTEGEKEKLVLSSELNVIFYLLEKNEKGK
ncbi:MAG: hypothetical protein ACWGHO_03640 [Candidatus Moraniibacteriota bacterium]